jgi:hypothetical protein
VLVQHPGGEAGVAELPGCPEGRGGGGKRELFNCMYRYTRIGRPVPRF